MTSKCKNDAIKIVLFWYINGWNNIWVYLLKYYFYLWCVYSWKQNHILKSHLSRLAIYTSKDNIWRKTKNPWSGIRRHNTLGLSRHLWANIPVCRPPLKPCDICMINYIFTMFYEYLILIHTIKKLAKG